MAPALCHCDIISGIYIRYETEWAFHLA